METYKKKSLKFMGLSRDVRNIERQKERSQLRRERFSIARALDDETISEENERNGSKIPAKGIPKVQSRIELLQKWKQEKMVKKQQESRLKKPVFKVGVTKPHPSPSIEKPLFALDASRRLYQSRFLVSNSQSFAKKPEIATLNVKTAKDMKIPSTKSKIVVPSKPESNGTRNKEFGIICLKPNADSASKVASKVQLPSVRKPMIASKPLETKKESRLQPLNVKPKVTLLPKESKSNIPSSGLPKPTLSRNFNKASDQTCIPKTNKLKIPDGYLNGKHIPVKSSVKSLPKFSKTLATQQKGNTSKPDNDTILPKFECDVSRIEPVKESRKSFAPEGFKFQPPLELNSSLFSEGPSSIFLKNKNQFLRTSTPKQSPSSQKLSPKTSDSEYQENNMAHPNDENTHSLLKENSLCSKDTDKKLESSNKYDVETLLSSSLETVFLNDPKPIDCKQSIKFELPEVSSEQNQEEAVLSTEIVHPEQPALVGRHHLDGAVSPPIPPGLSTIVKTEIESDCRQSLNLDFPKIMPLQNCDEKFLTSKDIQPENLLVLGLAGAINPFQADSVKIIKAENSSSDTTPSTVDNKVAVPFHEDKITAPFSEVDSVFYQNSKLDKIAERNQDVLKDNFLKHGNGHVKNPEVKTRNFRRSEKPGLPSITESLENTPKSAMKNKVLEGLLTPRRSLRLAKLSGNYGSLENMLDASRLKENIDKCDFAPRRSSRLSKQCAEFHSSENLFEVTRPTLYGSPEDEVVPKLNSRVTYDFDRLTSETTDEACSRPTRSGKVSLLYTPPNSSRISSLRRSIKGDLMSFSPNM